MLTVMITFILGSDCINFLISSQIYYNKYSVEPAHNTAVRLSFLSESFLMPLFLLLYILKIYQENLD